MSKSIQVREPAESETLVHHHTRDTYADGHQKATQSPLDKILDKIRIHNLLVRILLGEFLGTFVLVTIGVGSIAQFVLGGRRPDTFPPPFIHGNSVSIALGWGIAVMMGVYVSGEISGGHVNPAFTVAAAIFRRLPWRQVPFFFIGQYLGAFFGAVIVLAVYHDSLVHYHDHFGVNRTVVNDKAGTAGIFSTFPQDHVSTGEAFVDQIVATMLLVVMVLAITDERRGFNKSVAPFAVGMAIIGLLCSFEFNCGAALNPARDLSPRLLTLMAGWGNGVFSYRNYNWFWVPILGPHVGAIIGFAFYEICVGLHWQKKRFEPCLE